jgi:hypothetical protein
VTPDAPIVAGLPRAGAEITGKRFIEMLTTRTLGTPGLTVSSLGLALMGVSRAYRTAEEREEKVSGPRCGEKQMAQGDR